MAISNQNGNLLVSEEGELKVNNSYYFGTQHAGEVLEVTMYIDSVDVQSSIIVNETKVNIDSGSTKVEFDATINEDGYIEITNLDGLSISSLDIYQGDSSIESLDSDEDSYGGDEDFYGDDEEDSDGTPVCGHAK